LEHARDIGAAVGIIMERQKITQAEAFDRLRLASQNRNVKLYELALNTVLTGDIPQ
jgi:AmiR/NasT family two-component response regulator